LIQTLTLLFAALPVFFKLVLSLGFIALGIGWWWNFSDSNVWHRIWRWV